MDIIQYLLSVIQYLYQQNCWLIHFICRYIPLKQWAFEDSHSPKYQKFKIDELPLVTDFRQDWTYKELIPYYEKRYGKKIRPSAVVQSVTSLIPLPAHAVTLPSPFSTGITAPRDSSCAKSVMPASPLTKAASLPSNCAVRIAGTLWCPRKTAGTLSFISVSIPNALTISTTSKKWIRKT